MKRWVFKTPARKLGGTVQTWRGVVVSSRRHETLVCRQSTTVYTTKYQRRIARNLRQGVRTVCKVVFDSERRFFLHTGLNNSKMRYKNNVFSWQGVRTDPTRLVCLCHCGPEQYLRIYSYFSATSTKSQPLNIVLTSKQSIWLQRRLIGVKSVEEGDRISPFEGYWFDGLFVFL